MNAPRIAFSKASQSGQAGVRPHVRRASILLIVAAVLAAAGCERKPKAVPSHNGQPNPSGLPVPRYVTLKFDTVNARGGPGDDYKLLWVYRTRGLPLQIVANIGYDGAKGGDLDIVRAPNRTATGLLNPGAQPFNFEDSLGYSRLEVLRVNVRKRLQRGISLQGTYKYGHSIDNASSIGGSNQVVAQNDQDLNAEEGNSSFDVRQQLTGNWVFELPFGPNRLVFTKGGFWSKALDGFSLSGDFTFSTGTYFTPNYLLTVQETASGSSNSLRPNRNFSERIQGAQRLGSWFNAAAFTAPATGQFGTASRNSIEGPGQKVVDASLSRTVALGDTRSFEMRVTAANALNIVQYSGINTTLNSPTFGEVSGAAQMRTLTVFARYRF